ncbi:dual oxidase-like isoform X1 [Corticium candelabrum]|uniref:dual oxidase-like isoform X1 n=2 Tax=Corticium candelabrum TaxID=121492 RepID=UPI002E26ECE5|nr:dual oxidase-like isoform X1 [Corticium candelabrum]
MSSFSPTIADMTLTRRLGHAYEDGVYHPSGYERPNPLTISQYVMKGKTGKPSYMNRTVLMTFFGQQVVEEILDAQRPGCPPEYFNIDIPTGNELYDSTGEGNKVLPFLRTRYNMYTGYNPNVPRAQLNEITPWIDGGLMYGVAKAWADALRSFKNGSLACDKKDGVEDCRFPIRNDLGLPMANPPPPRDHVLKSSRRFFRLGNPRGNENPFLLTMGILWFRVHNHYAHWIQSQHPNWDDELVFNRARQWTIALHQKIVLEDWLPIFLGVQPSSYKGYKPSIHPGVTHVFQSAAMRFGHTIVPPGVIRRHKNCSIMYTTEATGAAGYVAVRTCNSYWNPQDAVEETDVDPLLMGMATQITEREDNIITEDLRGGVFGPLEFSRRDLMALNIQRGRDHGLPDYNRAREEYGLDRMTSFQDINPEAFDTSNPHYPELEHMRLAISNLSWLYNGSFDNLDIWPAGLLETTMSGPGPLFRAIILDQFERIRDADRFWYENKANGLFTDEEVDLIRGTTLYDLIINVTDIGPDDIQSNVFLNLASDSTSPCHFSFQLSEDMLDDCTEMKTFDYFTGSETPYIVTFSSLGLWIVLLLAVLAVVVSRRRRAMRNTIVQQPLRSEKPEQLSGNWKTIAHCWELMTDEGTRQITLCVITEEGCELIVTNGDGATLRRIDLFTHGHIIIWQPCNDSTLLLARVKNGHDLILRFYSSPGRDQFICELLETLTPRDIIVEVINQHDNHYILSNAITRQKRQQLVEEFMREVFACAQNSQAWQVEGKGRKKVTELVLDFELSKEDFSGTMGMTTNSLFVEQMFSLADADNNGFVTFRELLDLLVMFNKGSVDDKMMLLFNLYDIDNSGSLEREEFFRVTRSLLEIVNTSVRPDELDEMAESIFQSSNFDSKDYLTFDDFKVLMQNQGAYSAVTPTPSHDGSSLSNSRLSPMIVTGDHLQLPGLSLSKCKSPVHTRSLHDRKVALESAYEVHRLRSPRNSAIDLDSDEGEKAGTAATGWERYVRFIDNYKLQIFWVALFHLVVLLIFAERAYYFSVEREHAGLRRIAGYGVSITRGAASTMAFTYSVILLPMCRNMITYLRETPLNRFVPFDSLHGFHQHIAIAALLYTLLHIIGHALNFYHISTQTADDLTCLFRDYYHFSDELPKFQYWTFNTITGVTAILLVIVGAVIYIFAIPVARRYIYNVFWTSHRLYILFYVLLILHGAGRLVQAPLFHFFFLGPACLYVADKLISSSRSYIEISVIKAELLPSDVLSIVFKRPSNFDYKSGQWVRIACLGLSKNEYHPFTLTSAPHEEHLSVHVRAVGPWTNNLKNVYSNVPYPRLFIDGPFGEGHQDWHRYEVSILVGGGIGITPFASILKSVVNLNRNDFGKLSLKKMYFLWVTRTQKQFEWFTEIIREVEEADSRNMVEIHIFITQAYHKFDLRTTMLYICERHFERISGRSLFTGLQSITHFGRPPFDIFLAKVKGRHSDVQRIGVFSCGPPPMTKSVEAACSKENEYECPILLHHYENF